MLALGRGEVGFAKYVAPEESVIARGRPHIPEYLGSINCPCWRKETQSCEVRKRGVNPGRVRRWRGGEYDENMLYRILNIYICTYF